MSKAKEPGKGGTDAGPMPVPVRGRRTFQFGMLALLALMVVPSAVMATIQFQHERDAARAGAFLRAADIAELEGARQEARLAAASQLVATAAAVPEIHAGGPECNQTLAHILSQFPGYSNIFATDSNGVYTCSAVTTGPLDVSDREYFLKARATGNLTVGEYIVSRVTGRPTVVIAYPQGKGNFSGIIAAALNLDTWSEDLARAAGTTKTMLIALDLNGTIMARSQDAPRFVGLQVPFRESILGQASGNLVATGPDGAERLYAFHDLVDLSGKRAAYVVAGQDKGSVLGPIESAFQTNMIRFGAVTLIGLVAAWGTSDLTMGRKDRALRSSEARYRDLSASLEDRVVQRTAELEAANKELEAFAYSVSHDLRAPLRSLDGFSKILLEEYRSALPPDGQHYLNNVIESATEMTELVDALLLFSRAGRQSMTRQAIQPRDVVDQALNELKPAMEGRDIHIRIGDLPPADADPVLLRQVYSNLISNAVKFTAGRTPAVIEVDATMDNGTAVYFVKDNGAGFDMKYADKLFGIFQRLHRTEDFAGNGVGLAIVQRIVQRHGGKAWATGEVDKGAQFFFTLSGGNPT